MTAKPPASLRLPLTRALLMLGLISAAFAHLGVGAVASAQGLPADDLFNDEPASGAASDVDPGGSPADAVTETAEDTVATLTGDTASKEKCAQVNKAILIAAGLVDAAALALFFVVFWWIARRGRVDPTLLFFGVLVLVAIAAAVVVGLDRPNPETVLRCQQRASVAKVLLFDSLADWQRGALLGAAPVFVLAPLLKIVHSLLRR